MPIDIRTFPYRRELRPAAPESLGEHVDREYEKLEVALADFTALIADLTARVEALETP